MAWAGLISQQEQARKATSATIATLTPNRYFNACLCVLILYEYVLASEERGS